MLAGSAIISVDLITGAVLLTQAGAPPASPQQSGTLSAATAEPAKNTPVFSSDLVADPETGFARLGDAVRLIEELLGSRVIAHYRAICEPGGGAGAQDDIAPLALKGLTLAQGLEQLTIAVHLPEGEELAVHQSDNAYELAPQSFFDERDAVLIEYDIRALLDPPDGAFIEPALFANTVTSLIEPDLWGDRARLGMVSSTMLVVAHPRIHKQIEDLFTRIEARYDQQRAAQAELHQRELVAQLHAQESQLGHFRDGLSEIRTELDVARSQQHNARSRFFRLEYEAEQAEGEEVVDLRIERAKAEDGMKFSERRISDLEARAKRLRDAIADTEAEIRQVQVELAVVGWSSD